MGRRRLRPGHPKGPAGQRLGHRDDGASGNGYRRRFRTGDSDRHRPRHGDRLWKGEGYEVTTLRGGRLHRRPKARRRGLRGRYRSGPRPARLHGQRDRVRPGRRASSSTPSVASRTCETKCSAPSATRPNASARTGFASFAARASSRRSSSSSRRPPRRRSEVRSTRFAR